VSTLYFLNVTLHVLAAMLWLGGMLFLAVVGAPVLRAVEPPALRARIFSDLGRRFRAAGWAAIAVLVVTGVLNLHFRGLLRGDAMGSAAFWTTRYGRTLAWKLAAVGTMVAIGAVHDFLVGPASARLPAGTPAALRMRARAAWLARLNAAVGVVLVAAAVRLARGG
jgi:putative copper resistance protein D